MSFEKYYQKQKKAKVIRQLTPAFMEWKTKGQTLIGAFVSKASVQSKSAEQTYYQYIFETDNGLIKFHLGKATDNEIAEVFQRGVVYAVTFNGKEQIQGGRSVNKFNIVEIGYAEEVEGIEANVDDSDEATNE